MKALISLILGGVMLNLSANAKTGGSPSGVPSDDEKTPEAAASHPGLEKRPASERQEMAF